MPLVFLFLVRPGGDGACRVGEPGSKCAAGAATNCAFKGDSRGVAAGVARAVVFVGDDICDSVGRVRRGVLIAGVAAIGVVAAVAGVCRADFRGVLGTLRLAPAEERINAPSRNVYNFRYVPGGHGGLPISGGRRRALLSLHGLVSVMNEI